MKKIITRGCIVLLSFCLAMIVVANDDFASLRKSRIDTETEPPRMAPVENKDIKRTRNYPMQPPTIPHKIDGYQVDLSANQCLSCHSRRRVEESQAPMISVTHYMDRDGNFLAEVSPRRFFCNQCHVPLIDSEPIVNSIFQDVDMLLKSKE